MALFKYTAISRIRSCIEDGIYASRLDKVNDPYEGQGIYYKNLFRVVCLTASPFKMLMWAYYGNHQGCCVEFDVDEIEGIKSVEYIREFQSHEDMSTDEVITSLYKKGAEWEHEKEYRLVYHELTSDNKLWKRNGDDVFLKAPVKRIIFGYTAEMNDKYCEMLEFLKDYNDTRIDKIAVSKCKLQNGQYRLVENKQFDINAEIQRIKKMYSAHHQ